MERGYNSLLRGLTAEERGLTLELRGLETGKRGLLSNSAWIDHSSITEKVACTESLVSMTIVYE